MKALFNLMIAALLTASVAGLHSCKRQTVYDTPQRVVVAGKVENYNPEIPVTFSPNRVGFSGGRIPVETDGEGNFHAVFETYIPLDGWIGYNRTNFAVLLNPRDSLYVIFDGAMNDRPELLETIRFGGKGAKRNRNAAKYQQMYYSDPVYSDWKGKEKAKKEYEPEEYLKYNDSVRQKTRAIYERFVKECRPDRESAKWAGQMADESYYANIGFYPMDHRQYNGMGFFDEWGVPADFFSVLDGRLPLSEDELAAAYALGTFAQTYDQRVYEKMREERTDADTGWAIMPFGGMASSSELTDSLRINGIIRHVEDHLLREIMLTSYFDKQFYKQNVEAYEQFRDTVDKYITRPFLREPLAEQYAEIKARLESPELHSDAILKEAALSVSEMFSDIIVHNEGKVIYIDFWATWCGPCLSEFPNSKALEQDLHGKDVRFIYVCLESEKEKALATMAKYQLGGVHYIASAVESRNFRNLFGINGIPFYVLIDKSGVIQEKGSHLRPLSVKQKIDKLLQ